MKKSKLFMISSFALAMVASLVMAFAMMNVTKNTPSLASAESTFTVYFFDNVKDWWSSEDAYINIWGGDGSNGIKKMTAVEGKSNLFKYEYIYTSSAATSAVFLNASDWSTNDKQTTDVTLTNNHVYTIYNDSTNYEGKRNWQDLGDITNLSMVYFHKYSDWDDAYLDCWDTENGNARQFAWPGLRMAAMSNGWYSALRNVTTYESLNFNQGNDSKKFNAGVYSSAHPYCLIDGIWSTGITNISKYYVVSSKTSWILNTANVMDDATDGSDRAQLKYSATADEQIRVIKGDGTWIDRQDTNFGIGVDISASGADNIQLNSATDYVIHVDDSEGNGKTWVTNYLNLRSKISTDKKYYLMLTEFTLAGYSMATQVGYWFTKNGVATDYRTTTYYSSIALNGIDDPVMPADGNKFIVKEEGCTNNDVFVAQARIYNGDKVIACSDVKNYTVPAA